MSKRLGTVYYLLLLL